MAKEKKEPKVNKDGVLSKDAETILVGLMLSLVSLIGLLNKGPIGQFLTFVAVYLFGVFYFVAFLILLYVGIYLTFKRKMFKLKIDITLLGLILLSLGIMIASSQSNGELIILNNVFTKFSRQVRDISDGVLIKDIVKVEQTGGGLIGYFLTALLNTSITSTGTLIVSLVLMVAGLVLALYRPSKAVIDFIKKRQEKRKKRKEKEEAERLIIEEEEEKHSEKTEKETSYEYTSLDTSRQASKATFVFSSATPAYVKKESTALADDIEEEDNYVKTETTFENLDEEKIDEKGDENIEAIPINQELSIVTPKASKVTYTPSGTSSITTTTRTVATPIVKGEKKVKLPKREYTYPSLDLLNEYENAHVDEENERISIERQEQINAILQDFGIGATITGFKVGPSVTRFDLLTNRDVSINSVIKYIDDIAVRLGGMTNTRFEKVVKGKSTSGLEIPNAHAVTVSFKECISPYVGDPKAKYKVPFGKDITGDVIGVNVTDYPHMLVAGSTGSGKSVFIHNLIMSLIMKTTPDELKIMLIDPKRVEMSKYKEMPHLLCPIISEYDQSKVAMNKLVAEMERRYQLFEDAGVSKISQYNEYAEEEGLEPLPIIVVVIDEYADLVENCKDIASPVVKIAAKSRASGIHMVISTQRPSVNVITGVIKANLPTRVALRVASSVDSQTILGEGGAEDLLGYGDMLVDCQDIPGHGFTRLQCAFVDNKEIRRVVEFLKQNYTTKYDPEFTDLKDRTAMGPSFLGGGNQARERDERYEEVKAFVMDLEEVSISEIQRKMYLGFPKAARIMDQLEEAGVVAKATGNGAKRKVLIHSQEALAAKEGEEKDDSES